MKNDHNLAQRALQRSDTRKADPFPKIETVSGSGPVDGGVAA
jgi:hypothetical protein